MTLTIRNSALALVFALLLIIPFGTARAATTEDMLKMIQQLMTQVESLQKQLNAMRGDVDTVQSALKENLREGMTDADIEKLQKLLGTDPTIYPDGRVTGYYGPLTKEAVKRFQSRHGLDATGVVDGETHELLEEYLKEAFGGDIPPGLLRAPGIAKKIETRYEMRCDKSGHGDGKLCSKLKGPFITKPEIKETHSKDSHFNLDVEIEDGDATVAFKWNGKWYEATADGSNEDDVLEAIADELGKDVDELDAHLVTDVKAFLKTAKEDEDEDEDEDDFSIDLEIDDDETTVEFEYDGDDYEVSVDSTDEDDVLEAIADEIDEDVDDLEDDFVDAIKDALDDAKDDDDDDDFSVEIEIDDDETTVEFEYDGDDYEVSVDSTDEDDVLEAIADEVGTPVDELDDDFVDEVKEKLDDANDDAEDAEDEENAEDAIDEAEEAIALAEEAIDEADSNDDTTDAEELLDEAEEKLADAKEAFDDEDFADAEDLAEEARDLAEEAEDEV